jgi:undecaprenyl-diphosphatase
MSWIQSLIEFDYAAFAWIHLKLANKAFDVIMPFIRNQYFWGPLYLFLFILAYEKLGKRALGWALGFLVTFAFADYLSASLFKPMFQRTRPCNDSYWYDVIRPLVKKSKGYSLPSTHASNHFALSTYIVLTIGSFFPKIKPAAWIWASLVGLAQIYVGVHYPLDILSGALLGVWLGYMIGNYLKYALSL